MTVEKFKVTQVEAEQTYDTMRSMFSKDGRLNAKVARGYRDALRHPRAGSSDIDPQKLLDFSMLPPNR